MSLKHASLAWNKNRQITEMQPRKDNETSNKIRCNKLPLGSLNRLLETQASDISPQFYKNSLLTIRKLFIFTTLSITVQFPKSTLISTCKS